MSKAVIFDYDGVIVDNQPAQKMAWKRLSEEYDFTISDEELSSKIRGRPTLVGLKNFFGDRFTDEELKAIARRKEEIYIEIFYKDFKVVKGFNILLEDLKNHDIPMAIATSSTKEPLDFFMQRLKVEKYFDVVVTAEDITKSKPDPQVYLMTAEKMIIEPADCVVFEDSFSGVKSAKAAGMKVILMETTHAKQEFEDDIDLAISNFTEVSALDIIKL